MGQSKKHAARLERAFYAHDTLELARQLLGKSLVREWQGQRLSGCIVEVEAYIGRDDRACHARAGLTPRTAVMFGPPGHAYVYFTYGMHWLLNIVTEPVEFPAAILIRALEPCEGLAIMQRNRRHPPERNLCRGPARLTQALAIDRAQNGADLAASSGDLWLEDAPPIGAEHIATGARIGLGQTPEPWRSQPWRFYVAGSPFVSRP